MHINFKRNLFPVINAGTATPRLVVNFKLPAQTSGPAVGGRRLLSDDGVIPVSFRPQAPEMNFALGFGANTVLSQQKVNAATSCTRCKYGKFDTGKNAKHLLGRVLLDPVPGFPRPDPVDIEVPAAGFAWQVVHDGVLSVVCRNGYAAEGSTNLCVLCMPGQAGYEKMTLWDMVRWGFEGLGISSWQEVASIVWFEQIDQCPLCEPRSHADNPLPFRAHSAPTVQATPTPAWPVRQSATTAPLSRLQSTKTPLATVYLASAATLLAVARPAMPAQPAKTCKPHQ